MYEYQAKVIRVIDGDTVELLIDMGLRGYRREIIRLYGINTPEMNTPEGVEAKRVVEEKLPPDKEIKIRTYKDRQEKYGRWLATIVVDRLNLNAYLLRYGYAEEYK